MSSVASAESRASRFARRSSAGRERLAYAPRSHRGHHRQGHRPCIRACGRLLLAGAAAGRFCSGGERLPTVAPGSARRGFGLTAGDRLLPVPLRSVMRIPPRTRCGPRIQSVRSSSSSPAAVPFHDSGDDAVPTRRAVVPPDVSRARRIRTEVPISCPRRDGRRLHRSPFRVVRRREGRDRPMWRSTAIAGFVHRTLASPP